MPSENGAATNGATEYDSSQMQAARWVFNKLVEASSDISTRTGFSELIGHQYDSERRIYDAAGYMFDTQIDFEHFKRRHMRQGIARRIVEIFPEKCWNNPPEVNDPASDEGEMTPFEEAWEAIEKKHRVWNTFKRGDILNRMGNYAVVVMGLPARAGLIEDEVRPRDLRGPENLKFLSVFDQSAAEIDEINMNARSEQFGTVQRYGIDLSANIPDDLTSATDSFTAMKDVHASRVIHIAEGALDNKILGEPALMVSLNRLDDMMKIAASTAEAHWKEIAPVLHANVKGEENFGLNDDQKDALGDELQNVMDGLQRFLRTEGVEVDKISANLQDPSNSFEMTVKLLAAPHGIPYRVLIGSEKAELASSQDRRQIADVASERQTNFCGPTIVRPFIDRLINFGIIPPPEAGRYELEWPPIFSLTKKEKAEIMKLKAQAAKSAEDAAMVGLVGTPEEYADILDFDRAEPEMTDREFLEEEMEEGGEEVGNVAPTNSPFGWMDA